MTTMDHSHSYGAMAPRHTRKRKDGEQSFSMRGRVIWGVLFAVLLVGGIGGWAVTAKLSSAVIGVGTVRVDEDLKVIQHIDGGVLRQIAVREGDEVTAGQVLLQLDDVQIRAEQAIIMGQLAEFDARRQRLLAERDASETLMFQPDFLARFADAAMIADGEQQLFAGNQRNRLSQQGRLELQVGQLQEEINGLQFQQGAIDAELALVQTERTRMLTLVESQLIETTRISTVDREVARMQGQQGEIAAALARAASRITEVDLQILALGEEARTEAQRELRSVEARLAELAERLGAVNDRLARAQIVSPVSGTINELNVTTLGGVVSPAERLMTIVPHDADLSIEFRIGTNDIDQVAVGQDATLRFSAFNQRTTPEIDGTITRVSAAAQYDTNSGESYYLGQVAVTDGLENLGNLGLVPGMPVEVFVQTEEQTAIAYFAKPFTDQVSRAFREE